MIITKSEAKVFECLKRGMSQQSAADHLKVSRTAVKTNLSRLIIIGAIKRTGKGEYDFLIDPLHCEIVSMMPRGRKPSLHRPASPMIEDTTKSFIRQHYGKMPRREIAKRLNMNKYDLNLLIIEMGISKG